MVGFHLAPRPSIWVPLAEWYIDGRLRADTTNHQGRAIRLPTFQTLAVLDATSVFAGVVTTSAGASIILDIKHAPTFEDTKTSIFQGTNYPTIAAGDVHTGDTSSNAGIIDANYTFVSGGFWWLYVRQVGSTSGSEGIDLSVQVRAKVYVEP